MRYLKLIHTIPDIHQCENYLIVISNVGFYFEVIKLFSYFIDRQSRFSAWIKSSIGAIKKHKTSDRMDEKPE